MTSTPSSKPSTEVEVVRTLLASIVDYAGLFPPAERDMEAAAAEFASYRRGEYAWMLGSFVAPAARVEELARAARGHAPSLPWPVSVLVASAAEGARVVEEVGGRYADALTLAALEVRPLGAREIVQGHRSAPGALHGVDVFHEVPLDAEMGRRLDAVAAAGAHAKVRTGGVSAEAFPSESALARFLCACRERRLALKATAGLHHAFPGVYPLTYEPQSASGTMHGFLALALVAALVHVQGTDERESAALLAGHREALAIGGEEVCWHGRRLRESALARTRRSFFRSFGSCSFQDPIADLVKAGLL